VGLGGPVVVFSHTKEHGQKSGGWVGLVAHASYGAFCTNGEIADGRVGVLGPFGGSRWCIGRGLVV